MKADDLKYLARQLGLRKLRQQSKNLVCSCPFAPWNHKGNDRRPSFGIKIAEGSESYYNCFGCGERGDLLQLCGELGELRGEDYSELEEWILANEDIGLDEAIDRSEKTPQDRRQDRIDQFAAQAYPESEYIRYLVDGPPQYAYDRGLTPEAVAEWQIGDDPERGRMTLPVRRMKDKALVGIKGRTYVGDTDKYLPYLPWNQSSYLYGEHMVRPREEERRVVVVEGELDAIKVWMAGFTGLALMGSNVSDAQRTTILRLDRPVVLMPDNDKKGRAWANRLGDFLNEELSVRDAAVPCDKKDPGEMSVEEIREAVKKAKIRI